MKVVILVCLLPLILGASLDISNCPMFCPNTNETVWVLIPYCYAFRNKCQFDVIQCLLGPIFSQNVRVVSHEECKEHCNTTCLELMDTDADESLKQKCKDFLHTCRSGEGYFHW
ncbi:uncharacterized protein LOC127566094 [Drosophila albomicans]|uniref:Uncharacterized protein LOC127566094 n=1 Tax=Drosophila albomicans TaxID=7291 RepID=A0A9C6TC09_DROAB|nr:uncharacterized protein LOC127566094 [Drosophila albomicans]